MTPPDVGAEPRPADLVVVNARSVATLDADRRELAGGWVAITDGLVEAVGDGSAPAADGRSTRPTAWSHRVSSTPITTCTRTSRGRSRR